VSGESVRARETAASSLELEVGMKLEMSLTTRMWVAQ
jgi:hypothetical protein